MINRRYAVVFTVLRPLFYLYLRLFYNYRAAPCPEPAPGQPALILANHNCNLDPFLLAASFRRPIFFVASDHIFRLGFVSRLISFLVAPIPIVKSQIDLKTLRRIREIMSQGGIVGLFPEGNRSFNGKTGWISPATGKLARQLKSTLILYRIDGGYMTTPRWARSLRRGKMTGQAVKIIQPDELARMTPEAIQIEIETALQADAYREQRITPVPFKGSNLAENLELTLFVCPRCLSMATLKSKNNAVFCNCGLHLIINQLGFFEPQDEWSRKQSQAGRLLESVAAWDEWQRKYLIQQMSNNKTLSLCSDPASLIFSDKEQQLIKLERAVKSISLAHGSLQLYCDRLEFKSRQKSWTFKLEDISRIIVHGRMTLQFTTADGITYEVRTSSLRSAYKYVILFNLLQLKQKGAPYGLFSI